MISFQISVDDSFNSINSKDVESRNLHSFLIRQELNSAWKFLFLDALLPIQEKYSRKNQERGRGPDFGFSGTTYVSVDLFLIGFLWLLRSANISRETNSTQEDNLFRERQFWRDGFDWFWLAQKILNFEDVVAHSKKKEEEKKEENM